MDATEALKKLADAHCQSLLEQLSVEKLRKNKRVETAKCGLDQHRRHLNSFSQYCQASSPFLRVFKNVKGEA